MGIGLAILIAAILFLIDRNHAWPQAWHIAKRAGKVSARIAVILVVSGLVTWGIFYAWSKAKDAREHLQQEAAAREAAQWAANADPYDIVACANEATNCPLPPNATLTPAVVLKATCSIWENNHPTGSGVDWVGPRDNSEVLYPPRGCEGPLENAYETKVTDTLFADYAAIAAKARKTENFHTVRLKKSSTENDFCMPLNTTEFGYLQSGVACTGDVLTLLQDDGPSIKVRTPKGIVGWALSGEFEVINK